MANPINTYVQEAVEELNQVRWPTRQQAIRLSIIVLGFVFASSFALGFVDYLLNKLILVLLFLA